MKVAAILFATQAAAEYNGENTYWSKGKNGKFANFASAEQWCQDNGAMPLADQSLVPNLQGKKQSGWYWVAGSPTMPKIAKHATSERTLTEKQVKERGMKPFAACDDYVVEYEPACQPAGGLEAFANDYVFYPDEGIISHSAARKTCQDLGDEWDLVIISNSKEYNFLVNSINDNCWNDMAWWLGFYETGEIAEAGDEGTVTTVFGKQSEWELKWARDSDFGQKQNEPNNQKGAEDCVRMKNGKLNDAMCDEGWTGVQRNNIGMGFVCERHPNIDTCEPAKKTPDNNPNYRFHTPVGGIGRSGARANCKAMGAGWDLAVINDAAEHSMLVEQCNCARNAYWLGVKEIDGNLFTDAGSPVGFSAWDTHSNVLNHEANNQQGDEQCVRLRGSQMNDALCDRTWTGPERLGIPMGYICEYTAPECSVAQNAKPLEDEEYKIFPQYAPNTWTFVDARQKCKSLGKNWDLVIFNYQREHQVILEILEENCVNDHAYWVGYNEVDGVASTIFGRQTDVGATTSIALPWDTESNQAAPEPNDWLGEENCVRMHAEFGLMNDAICSRTWTGGPKAQTGMGVICEKHNPCEEKRGLPADAEFEDDKYYIAPASFIDANEAKAACKARGEGWDLVVIEDPKEHKLLNDKLNGCNPYWVGMTNPSGNTLLDLQGNRLDYAVWDTHLGHHINPDEPNDVMGEETCVRMRGGKYNDALCNDENGFNKKEKQGYICEHTPVAPVDPEDRPENCLECGQNTAVLPWKTRPGCKKPIDCKARLEIVDAWKKGNGKDRPKRWGFVGKIKIPKQVIDNGAKFSVLIRFSKKVTHGHFQLWNMNFWNFYNGGYEILIHSKWWNTDRHDKYSVAFVAEELNSDEYPELLFWFDRQTQHHCFQPSMHHGQNNNHGSAYARSGGAGGVLTSGLYDASELPELMGEPVYGSSKLKVKNGKLVQKKKKAGPKRYRRSEL